MEEYEIIPLRIGQYADLELSSLTYMRNQGKKIMAPLIAYLIRGEGVTVLVDTGGSDEKWSAAYHTRVIRPEEETLPAQLRKHGVSLGDVRHIVNTHLHWDHCFNNDMFPQAAVYVQEREIQYAQDPLPAHRKFYEAPSMGFIPKWSVLSDQLRPISGDMELFPGIDIISLPGHTPGFQGVLVRTARGRCMIAGDSVGLLSNWEGRSEDERLVSGIFCSLDDCYKSLRRIGELSDYVLPGHDPYVFEHLKA